MLCFCVQESDRVRGKFQTFTELLKLYDQYMVSYNYCHYYVRVIMTVSMCFWMRVSACVCVCVCVCVCEYSSPYLQCHLPNCYYSSSFTMIYRV
jgi:hypothetical protein